MGIIKPVFTSFFFSWRGRTHYIRLRLSISQIRPTQSIMYVPLLVNRFGKIIFVIVQYKYLKSCSEDFILKNQTKIWSSAQDHAALHLLLSIVGFFISVRQKSAWQKRFVPQLYQLRRGILEGPALKYFWWFIGAGGEMWRCLDYLFTVAESRGGLIWYRN